MRNKVSNLRRQYNRKKSERNLQLYIDKTNEYKALCTETKETDFKDFLETLPDIKTLSNFHKAVTKERPPQINSLLKNDGSYSTPGTETAKTLIKKHFPAHTPLMSTNYSGRWIESHVIHGADYDWITEDLTKEAMAGFQAKKSPGPDGLKPCLLYTSPSPRD